MRRTLSRGHLFLLAFSTLGTLGLTASYPAADLVTRPEVRLLHTPKLPGSFLSPQTIYADSERIYACSFQGDIFVLERDRRSSFRELERIKIGSPLTGISGDAQNVYVSSSDGNLYVFAKTWPLQFVQAVTMSYYGLSSVQTAGSSVYVGKGQAALAASADTVYVSQLNPGDLAVQLNGSQSYGEEFVPGTILAFDRATLKLRGQIPNTAGAVNVSAWQDFVFRTTPGCCGAGIDVYDARSLSWLQFINRPANTAAATRRRGVSLMVSGSESGSVDLFGLTSRGFELTHSVDLRSTTGFTGSEDIEIRSLWVDGLDNLVFAGSSWGNDASRSPDLPSFFILELRSPGELIGAPTERPGS